MTDIHEIKRQLADRALDVAMMLVPGGRKEGTEYRAGSTSGGKGQSLGVHLSGSKAGIWADFATNESGDILDLWCAAKRVNISQAIDEARAYLGIQRHESSRDPRPSYTRPPKPVCVKPKERVLDYLQEERSIPREVLELYRIGEDGDRIVFPFLLPDGTLAMAKTRQALDGARPKPTAADCEPVLFGWQAIPENAREVTITEGEIDAMSMARYGFPAMSVPFGGGGGRKQQWIENDFERLERFERIYIATDMDEPGEQAAVEIASRLGRHRCFRVKLPRKDANECLVEGVSIEDMRSVIAAAESLDPEGLRRAGAFADKIARLFWPTNDAREGYSMPYAGIYGKLLFRPGEVTLWSGSSGSGKSQIISDCIPKWIQEGSRVCIASFEMQPQWTLKRLVKQTGGTDRPSVEFINAVLGYLDAGLLLYEKVGKSSIKVLLEIFDYARAKYGCDQFVIDSLMRLGIAGDDYSGQEQAVYQMVDWAITNNVHLHLVAHSRKGERDRGAPDGEDVKGAMEIIANAFNIVTIWRDRKHEDDLRAAQTDEERHAIDDKPGVILNVAKQRNGDFEGKVRLWFNMETYQYFAAGNNRKAPRNYVKREDEQRQLLPEDINVVA